ncbi:MAG: hypothetical protein MUF50_04845 [Planctomycetes bacterium]|jgi:hypothetical protein|nr:hypothetical protein [Planctomycetota bacterium]
MKGKKTENENKEIKELNWLIPEYHKHDKSRNWYIGAIIIAVAMVIYSLVTLNFLFALIIIMAAVIIIINDHQEPSLVNFVINRKGIGVGKRFYEYSALSNFAVLYKPRENVKSLYFEFKNPVLPRLSIPLEKSNPVAIRDFLNKYLTEDLERNNLPLSEQISRLFKL